MNAKISIELVQLENKKDFVIVATYRGKKAQLLELTSKIPTLDLAQSVNDTLKDNDLADDKELVSEWNLERNSLERKEDR